MRNLARLLAAFTAVMISSSVIAQSSTGRWEGRSPRFFSVPQTAWVKAEVLAADPVSQQAGEAINRQLRLRGYNQMPGGAYMVRLELHGRGLVTPVVPIPGYDSVTPRLGIWPEPEKADTVYLSLLVYHQSTGQVIWQGEAMCPGLSPDANNVINAMIGPLLDQMGVNGKGRLDCRNL